MDLISFQELALTVAMIGGIYGGVKAIIEITSWVRSRKLTHLMMEEEKHDS